MAVIRCRARAISDCERGCTTTMGDLRSDSTWDGESIVCNACYIEIEPLMKMNAPGGVLIESNAAIKRYMEAQEYVRAHAAPLELVREAREVASEAAPGSPRRESAIFLARLARREIERRK